MHDDDVVLACLYTISVKVSILIEIGDILLAIFVGRHDQLLMVFKCYNRHTIIDK